MAAGLGFKDFVTGEVLTAADVDGYLMQGVWVFASAAARDAAVTSPQEGNFAYLKDTNVTTYYTGSAWANLDTTGMTNPMTTTGDIIYSSPGSTPVRLGIGSTGNVLTVASGVPSWSAPASGGGMTLLDTLTMTGSSVTSSTFSSAYKQLFLYLKGLYLGTANDLLMRINGDTGATSYTYRSIVADGTVLGAGGSNGDSKYKISGLGTSSTARFLNYGFVTIMKPSATDNFFISSSAQDYQSDTRNWDVVGVYAGSAAITNITIFSGQNFSGGTVEIYGVN
jgi:hypothetical protein